VELPVDPPLGLFADSGYRSTRIELRPRDRLVLVTDGMLERNAAGLDLPEIIADGRKSHPREAVRVLADRVLQVCDGVLGDDATVLCLDWHGQHGRDRSTSHGSDDFPRSNGGPDGH
jgi:serine phosphatase RsbU (regulator of sigma subunit)